MSSPTATSRKHQVDLHPFEEAYKQAHRNPRLSRFEIGIGGHGGVGTLRNGPGPNVMLRADMDALPHLEKTGLSYAGTKISRMHIATTLPVMHACGHDMPTVNPMAAASILSAAGTEGSGSVIFLFQPADEIAYGARAMLKDGLYDGKRFNDPKTDMVLGSDVHESVMRL